MEKTAAKHTILYADDDSDDLYLVKESFTGYSNSTEVLSFPDGLDLWDYLVALPISAPLPCLIILDINMPRLNGKDTLMRIRSNNRFSDIPVVLFSTSSSTMDKLFANQHNAGFITKPLNAEEITVLARHFIDHCTGAVKSALLGEAV